MTLSRNEREMLRLIAKAPESVTLNAVFDQMNPHRGPTDEVPADDPRCKPWADSALALYGASVSLCKKGLLVRVAHPEGGGRLDLVEVTDACRAALARSQVYLR
ncbi:hypothetical protein [Streptomyces palmae]|uniref:MarR family transcriptional regulator n=1 Tax=Streptomyces palmae TaxID=1701085 RepID=A0A4Z0HDP7_9ACTN|nr:hypothetical protein [Streptomyces palmae]TGB15985.1 hypothetical protein E4099_05915 [Streptomyces palmae]